ncbi:hypothetical protein [Nonomuraea glycinis]|uniref:hypothetical protein n=1 Tax=Nonomuraea glycinis TaxID=2047744 RepID=UPI00339FB4D0
MSPEDAAEALREVDALIHACEDVQRATTPEEKAAAGLRLEIETTYAMASLRERQRQRLLQMIRNGTW